MNKTKIAILSLLIGILINGAASTPTSNGQDAATFPSIDVEFSEKPEMPQRQVAFTESKESAPIQLFAADPKLLEQRYVATIILRWPKVDRKEYIYATSGGRIPAALAKLKNRYWSTLVDPNSRSREPRRWATIAANKFFEAVAETTPAESKPPQATLKLLFDSKHCRVVGRSNASQLVSGARTGDNEVEVTQTIQFLGPDVETTKAMSLAVLKLFDHGLSIPIQKQMIAEMQEEKSRLPDSLTAYKTQLEKSELLAKQLEELEPITPETIADLKTQKRLIAVDIAGAQARIDACDKILARNDIRGKKTTEQVESIKITAEIELVGLTARQEAIGKIIDAGNQRRQLALNSARQSSIAVSKGRVLNEQIKAIRSKEQSRKRFVPITVDKDEIVIQPIKWEPADSTSGFGAPSRFGR